ncbi:MAG TPA: ATP-binding protein [Acidimicrobiales bacterium]|nr:ATP-binding protein [Acidimicrobiales bacterium]
MRNARPLSLWAVVVGALVVGLSVGGFFVVRRGVESQNQALLQNNASQIELLLQGTFQNLTTQLRSAAFFTVSAGSTQDAFATQAKGLLTSPGSSAALVDTAPTVPRVVAAVGADLHQGQALPAALAQFAQQSGTTLSARMIHLGGTSLLALAAAPTTNPKVITLLTTQVHPDRVTPNKSGPYTRVFLALYATPSVRADQLILTTYGPGSLPAPTASARLKLGSIDWLIVVAAKSPLAGEYAQAEPWIVLAVGVIVALALGLVVELLARRQRHTEELVAERTAELLEAQRTLVRQERLSAVGELAGVVSHELRNPLGAAINHLFLVRHYLGDASPEAERHVTDAERSVNRAVNLTEDLTAYMRDRELQISTVDFSALLGHVLESAPPPQGVEVVVDSSTTFDADSSLMTQVVSNLVTNAYESMPDGGAVHVGASRDHDATLITVQDGGSGIDPEVAPRVFDPFFTTKDGGTGLGLAIVHRMVTLHHGRVGIDNVPGGGARVTIELPFRRPGSDNGDGARARS